MESGELPEAAAPEDTHASSVEATPDYASELAGLKSAMESERRQRQQAVEELNAYRQHFQLWNTQMQQQAQHQPAEEEVSLSDDDIPSWGMIKSSAKPMQKEIDSLKDEIKGLRRQLQGDDPASVQSKYSDFQEVVQQYLPEYVQKHPHIRDVLQSTQDYELAYRIAKSVQAEKQAATKPKVHEDVQKLVQNAEASGSLASVGQSSATSSARRWRDMSPEEFRSHMARHVM